MFRLPALSLVRPYAALLLLPFALATATPASAADYVVTSSTWGTTTDVGSFAWAVEQSNTNPGIDTIRVTAGLDINVDTGSRVGSNANWLTAFTDAAVVEGNNARLVGNPSYLTSTGDVATKTNIVSGAYGSPFTPTDVILTPGVSFAKIGTYNQDNTGIDVTIRNLNADGVASIASVNQHASLTVEGGRFDNIVNYTESSGRAAFATYTSSTLNLNGVALNRNFPFGQVIPISNDAVAFLGSISSENSTVNVQNSTIDNSYGGGAVAMTGGTTNIVSSILRNSGGVQVGDGTMNLTNSIISFNSGGETLQQTTRLLAQGSGAVLNVTASTVLYNSLFTTGPDQPFDNSGMPLTATLGGTLNFDSSVVVPLNWDTFYAGKDTYVELQGGTLTTDGLSYIAATASQDQAALEALFGSTGFLTSGETFSIIDSGGTDFFENLPVGAVPLATSPLVDAIPNAGTGGANELLNPIDGTPLLFDVYGNARTNGLGFRNIGAVQAVPEPQTYLLALLGSGLLLGYRRWQRRGSAATAA